MEYKFGMESSTYNNVWQQFPTMVWFLRGNKKNFVFEIMWSCDIEDQVTPDTIKTCDLILNLLKDLQCKFFIAS